MTHRRIFTAPMMRLGGSSSGAGGWRSLQRRGHCRGDRLGGGRGGCRERAAALLVLDGCQVVVLGVRISAG